MLTANKEAIKETASQIIESLRELELTPETLNHTQRRDIQKALQSFIKKNKLYIPQPILENKDDVDGFIINVFDGDSTASKDGVIISVNFLREQRSDKILDLQPRSYQREKVAKLIWKQEIIKTILLDKQFKIPAVHIRILRNEDNTIKGYEVADGQQRVTAILDFMDGKFSLPKGEDGNSYGKFKGLSYSEILAKHYQDAMDIKNYGLSTILYDNFTDEDIATLFIKILNNVESLVVQEKNNATRSYLADFVRYTSRNGNGEWTDKQDMFHPLFNRTTSYEGTPKEVIEWDYFNNLGMGRMEGDQWLASLIYLYLSGWSGGVTPTKLQVFYEETSQQSGHNLGWNFKDKLATSRFPKLEKDIIKLLDIGKKIGDWVTENKDKSYLRPNFFLFILLFVNDYMDKFSLGKSVDWNKFSKKMVDVVDKWNNPKVYEFEVIDDESVARYQANGTTPLGPFKSLWGAFNSNVINTALDIFNKEMGKDPDWGFVEIDSRVSFSDSDIEKRWNEVGRVCEYTGEPIALKDVVGDHATPRSWGVKMEGVTEYDNLRVTTAYHNGRKLQMNEEAYRAKLEQEKKSA